MPIRKPDAGTTVIRPPVVGAASTISSCRSPQARAGIAGFGALTFGDLASRHAVPEVAFRAPAVLPGPAAALTPPATRATARGRRGEEHSECPGGIQCRSAHAPGQAGRRTDEQGERTDASGGHQCRAGLIGYRDDQDSRRNSATTRRREAGEGRARNWLSDGEELRPAHPLSAPASDPGTGRQGRSSGRALHLDALSPCRARAHEGAGRGSGVRFHHRWFSPLRCAAWAPV